MNSRMFAMVLSLCVSYNIIIIKKLNGKKGVKVIFSLIFAVILGAIVAGLTGIDLLFWVVSIFVFVCSLPFALIDGYIQSKIDYVQDREDYRQAMHEIAEEERMDKYLDKLDDLDEYYDDDPDI